MRTPRYRSFAEPLAAQAEAIGNEVAFVYLEDGDRIEQALTFNRLHELALGLAHGLRRSAERGDRALLLMAPGLEYLTAIYGCFYAGVIGVSAPPPNPRRARRALNRLLAIATDAEVSVVLTTAPLLRAAREAMPADHPLAAVDWLAVDEFTASSDTSVIVAPDPGDLAFLQYTSGSTVVPRGVRLTHANLLDNSRFIATAFGHRHGATIGFNWIPPFHDMGLIGAILQPTYCGVLSVLASPTAIVKNPLLWLKGIDHYRATTSGGPNFFYDLCVERVHDEDCAGLNLSSWNVAFNGAEPVRAETMAAFAKKFEPAGFKFESFLPCYGLAEATLMVAAASRRQPPTLQRFEPVPLLENRAVPSGADGDPALVGCGKQDDLHRLRIVDPETEAVAPPGEIGEIWVAGPSVADGYQGAEREGQRVFGAKLSSPGDASQYLRTGDLGVVHCGELFVVGRLSDLIVIRGRNYHPHDIEALAESAAPWLISHASAAFELQVDNRPGVALVAEVKEDDRASASEAIKSISNRVAKELDLPLVLVTVCPRGTVPKTTSGKVQRRLCRSLLLAGELETVFEWRASPRFEAALRPR